MPNGTVTKPECELTTCDGNVFAIIGRVARTLRRAGLNDRANEFTDKAHECETYSKVLQLCFDYVEVM